MNQAECICISLDCYSFVSLTKWLFNVIRHEAYGECKGEILAVKPGVFFFFFFFFYKRQPWFIYMGHMLPLEIHVKKYSIKLFSYSSKMVMYILCRIQVVKVGQIT